MKRLVSVLLCLILVFLATSVAFAQNEVTPVIFVPGYTASRMYIYRATENEKRVWKIDVADELIDALKKEIPALLADSGMAVIGNYTPLFKTLEPYANEITEYLRINDDGTSKYDVEVYPHAAQDTRLDKLREIGYYPDYDTLKFLGKQTADENVFCCTLDWRLGQVDNAAVLSEYIDEVLEMTGAEKVNLIGVSYGGQVTASYLSLYGGDKVNKAVLHCPALDGSSIVPQLFSDGGIDVAWTDALRLIQTFSGAETDLSEITDVINPDFLNGFLKEFIVYYLLDLFLNFGSAWDLVPVGQYPALRDKLLNDGRHTEIIAKSDKYHFEVAANLKQNLSRLRSEGVQISIIAGYGSMLVTDNGMSSDSVIEVASSTGAVCAEVGESLPDGYVKSLCEDDTHCHISPDMCIDAAAGYLPENTWYVKDMFHGMGVNEKAVSALMADLLFTDSVTDVHSNTKYPQFMVSDNPFTGVFCSFSSCAQGYCTPYSTEMTITNLSKESEILIDGIKAEGTSLKFSYAANKRIAPGESITVQVCGVTPDTDLDVFDVKVNFITVRSGLRVPKSRTLSFRFTDGSLYGDVLDSQVSDTSPVIQDGEAKVTGRFNILSFFVRLLYNIRKLISGLIYA